MSARGVLRVALAGLVGAVIGGVLGVAAGDALWLINRLALVPAVAFMFAAPAAALAVMAQDRRDNVVLGRAWDAYLINRPTVQPSAARPQHTDPSAPAAPMGPALPERAA